jgi:hypothetical protein
VAQWRQDAQCGTAGDHLLDSRIICEHVGRGQTGRVSLLPRAFWIRKGDVFDSRVELRRLIGKVALPLAGVYILVLFAAVVAALSENRISAWGWPLLTLPGFAFVPAVADALRLHRTTDPAPDDPVVATLRDICRHRHHAAICRRGSPGEDDLRMGFSGYPPALRVFARHLADAAQDAEAAKRHIDSMARSACTTAG